MKTSANGRALIRESEGLRLKAYPDPATGGRPWTIGYGHTRGIMPGQMATRAACEIWLDQDIAVAEAVIARHVRVPLKQHEYDALVDFIFNIGEPRFAQSTLLRKLNEGDKAGVGDEFQRWIYADHKILRGLVTRARKRQALWSSTPATIVAGPPPQQGWAVNLWKRIWGQHA